MYERQIGRRGVLELCHDAGEARERKLGLAVGRAVLELNRLALAGRLAALEHDVGKLLDRGTGRNIWESPTADRKSTRLNSSHQIISYAVFCLKKKKTSH